VTYSIVARDPETGELGVAVQSRAFSVGNIVSWAEAGVGAVATQSFANADYGALGLDAMRAGEMPDKALERLCAADEDEAKRQVAFVDTRGRVAAHTGSRCIPSAGHLLGDAFSVQANLMDNDGVVPAMKAAFETASGPLADRLLATLDAAEAAGGDLRGRQSACLLLVSGTRPEKRWEGRLLDLRVDDHPEPLVELRRLLTLHRAYDLDDRGTNLAREGNMAEALALMSQACDMVPGEDQLMVFHGVTLVASGDTERGHSFLRRALEINPRWMAGIERFTAAGHTPLTADQLEEIRKLL
jgi:uncharacterized Ntn-hydrolase superfamily protein